jgi:type 1 glutamine amidotransferase
MSDMNSKMIGALILVCVSALLATPRLAADQASDIQKRVLIVTGEDYPGHKWQETYPVVKAGLEQDARLHVDVLSDLKQLAQTPLEKYDAVVLHFKNYDPAIPGRAGLDHLMQFVERGGGLMLLHFSCGAFEEFRDQFITLAGRVWFGEQPPAGRHQHDPRGTFTVNLAGDSHPITAGMRDFETLDELYTCLEGEVPITAVATAKSKVDGKTYPIAFVLQFGKGRVFHSVLGHDTVALEAPGPSQLHRRGCAWVCGLSPDLRPKREKSADR